MNEDINRLKVVLAEKKKTNRWLATQIGKDEGTVSKWCTNTMQPNLETLREVAKVLDVDFLKLPKFKSMVNGGSDEFPTNGWHGMYVFSEKETNDRIFPIAFDFELFKSHAMQAARQWTEQRQWLNSDWRTI